MTCIVLPSDTPPSRVVQDIADYVHDYDINSKVAYDTARLCLMDSLGCHMEALRFPSAAAVCGPVVEGTVVPNGAKVGARGSDNQMKVKIASAY